MIMINNVQELLVGSMLFLNVSPEALFKGLKLASIVSLLEDCKL